jgi:hypothetical protein
MSTEIPLPPCAQGQSADPPVFVVEIGGRQADLDTLGEADGSEPGFRRPVLIISSDAFNYVAHRVSCDRRI